MSTTAQVDGQNYTFAKGAPDFMIKQCTHYINKDGERTLINDNFVESLQNQIDKFAELTLRTLLIGYKDGGDPEDIQEKAFSNLTVLALVGIKDPIREEIVGAVSACKTAGVKVRMITGDN
jgi:Ca2+-transporting ATPase